MLPVSHLTPSALSSISLTEWLQLISHAADSQNDALRALLLLWDSAKQWEYILILQLNKQNIDSKSKMPVLDCPTPVSEADVGSLCKTYLTSSPKIIEILSMWPSIPSKEHSNSHIAPILLDTIAILLRICSRERRLERLQKLALHSTNSNSKHIKKIKDSKLQTTVPILISNRYISIGLTVARLILRSRMKVIYNNLVSDIAPLTASTLRLLTAIISLGSDVCKEVCAIFDFSYRGLSKVCIKKDVDEGVGAMVIRAWRFEVLGCDCGSDAATLNDTDNSVINDDNEESNSNSKKKQKKRRSHHDRYHMTIRECWLYFITTLLHIADTVTLSALLSKYRHVSQLLLSGVETDTISISYIIIVTLKSIIFRPYIPRRVKTELFSIHSMKAIATLLERVCLLNSNSSIGNESRLQSLSYQLYTTVQSLVLYICCGRDGDTSLAVLQGPREMDIEAVITMDDVANDEMDDIDKNSITNSLVKTSVNESSVPIISMKHDIGVSRQRGDGNTLLVFLLSLKPNEDITQQALTISILKAWPTLISSYLARLSFSLEPRDSIRWSANMRLITKIINLSPPLIVLQSLIQLAADMTSHVMNESQRKIMETIVFDSIIPPILTKSILSKCFNHASPFVAFIGVHTLVAILNRVATLVSMAVESSETPLADVTRLSEETVCNVLSSGLWQRLPDIATIITLKRNLFQKTKIDNCNNSISNTNNRKEGCNVETEPSNTKKRKLPDFSINCNNENNENDIKESIYSIVSPEWMILMEISIIKIIIGYQRYVPLAIIEGRLDYVKLIPNSFINIHPSVCLALISLINVALKCPNPWLSSTTLQTNEKLCGLLSLCYNSNSNISNAASLLVTEILSSSGYFGLNHTSRIEIEIWLKYLPVSLVQIFCINIVRSYKTFDATPYSGSLSAFTVCCLLTIGERARDTMRDVNVDEVHLLLCFISVVFTVIQTSDHGRRESLTIIIDALVGKFSKLKFVDNDTTDDMEIIQNEREQYPFGKQPLIVCAILKMLQYISDRIYITSGDDASLTHMITIISKKYENLYHTGEKMALEQLQVMLKLKHPLSTEMLSLSTLLCVCNHTMSLIAIQKLITMYSNQNKNTISLQGSTITLPIILGLFSIFSTSNLLLQLLDDPPTSDYIISLLMSSCHFQSLVSLFLLQSKYYLKMNVIAILLSSLDRYITSRNNEDDSLISAMNIILNQFETWLLYQSHSKSNETDTLQLVKIYFTLLFHILSLCVLRQRSTETILFKKVFESSLFLSICFDTTPTLSNKNCNRTNISDTIRQSCSSHLFGYLLMWSTSDHPQSLRNTCELFLLKCVDVVTKHIHLTNEINSLSTLASLSIAVLTKWCHFLESNILVTLLQGVISWIQSLLSRIEIADINMNSDVNQKGLILLLFELVEQIIKSNNDNLEILSQSNLGLLLSHQSTLQNLGIDMSNLDMLMNPIITNSLNCRTYVQLSQDWFLGCMNSIAACPSTHVLTNIKSQLIAKLVTKSAIHRVYFYDWLLMYTNRLHDGPFSEQIENQMLALVPCLCALMDSIQFSESQDVNFKINLLSNEILNLFKSFKHDSSINKSCNLISIPPFLSHIGNQIIPLILSKISTLAEEDMASAEVWVNCAVTCLRYLYPILTSQSNDLNIKSILKSLHSNSQQNSLNIRISVVLLSSMHDMSSDDKVNYISKLILTSLQRLTELLTKDDSLLDIQSNYYYLVLLKCFTNDNVSLASSISTEFIAFESFSNTVLNFAITVLRCHFFKSDLLLLLTRLIDFCYVTNEKHQGLSPIFDLRSLHDMLLGHSKFSKTMLIITDTESKQVLHSDMLDASQVRQKITTRHALACLLLSLVIHEPSCCEAKLLPAMLSFYGASMNITDQLILYILWQYEMELDQEGDPGIADYLWGSVALRRVQERIHKISLDGSTLEMALGDGTMLNSAMLSYSSDHFPYQRRVDDVVNESFTDIDNNRDCDSDDDAKVTGDLGDPSDTNATLSTSNEWKSKKKLFNRRFEMYDLPAWSGASLPLSGTYDPAYVLTFLSHALENNLLDAQSTVECGGAAFTIASLSSNDIAIRKYGYKVLTQFYTCLSSSSFRDQPQILMILKVLKESITSKYEQISALITTFIIMSFRVVRSPTHPLYRDLNKWYLARSSINVNDIPSFNEYFMSDDINHRRQRFWLLSLLSRSIHLTLDISICRRNYVYSLCMSLYESHLCDNQSRYLIQQFICQSVSISIKTTLDILSSSRLLLWFISLLKRRNESIYEDIKTLSWILSPVLVILNILKLKWKDYFSSEMIYLCRTLVLSMIQLGFKLDLCMVDISVVYHIVSKIWIIIYEISLGIPQISLLNKDDIRLLLAWMKRIDSHKDGRITSQQKYKLKLQFLQLLLKQSILCLNTKEIMKYILNFVSTLSVSSHLHHFILFINWLWNCFSSNTLSILLHYVTQYPFSQYLFYSIYMKFNSLIVTVNNIENIFKLNNVIFAIVLHIKSLLVHHNKSFHILGKIEIDIQSIFHIMKNEPCPCDQYETLQQCMTSIQTCCTMDRHTVVKNNDKFQAMIQKFCEQQLKIMGVLTPLIKQMMLINPILFDLSPQALVIDNMNTVKSNFFDKVDVCDNNILTIDSNRKTETIEIKKNVAKGNSKKGVKLKTKLNNRIASKHVNDIKYVIQKIRFDAKQQGNIGFLSVHGSELLSKIQSYSSLDVSNDTLVSVLYHLMEDGDQLYYENDTRMLNLF